MKRIHNRQLLLDRRKELRNNTTSQEQILWWYLKESNLGYKFRRQHSIGPYIVDFYCPDKKIVIEIDGSQHGKTDAREYDQERSQYLRGFGYAILRFWNHEINANLAGVLLKIKQTIEEVSPPLLRRGAWKAGWFNCLSLGEQ